MDSSNFSVVLYTIFSSGHITVLVRYGSTFQEIDCGSFGEWNAIVLHTNITSTQSPYGNYTNNITESVSLTRLFLFVLEHTEFTSIEVKTMFSSITCLIVFLFLSGSSSKYKFFKTCSFSTVVCRNNGGN